MKCWKCQADITSTFQKIGFRETCSGCGSWLHVCKQCKNYQPGRPNQCMIPDTEFVSDRESANYCEEFSACLKDKIETKSMKEVQKKLFEDLDGKIDTNMNQDLRFLRLFKDEE